MKRYTCIFPSIIPLFLHTLLTPAAAFPASIPLVNAPIFQIANASLTSTSLDPLGTRVPFVWHGVKLVFTKFGKTIPQAEVQETLGGAHKLVEGQLDIAPEEGIPQNRFEYRLPQGNVLLAIGCSLQRGITWRVLYRILQALERFVVAQGPPLGSHYKELNFDIQGAGSERTLGYGVIWYFPPRLDNVQKRTTTTPISAVSDASLLALNASSGLTKNDILYPILGTSMTLEFYYLGLSLPHDLVTLNLRGAIKEAFQYSFGPQENQTIRDGVFRVVTGGSVSSVATTVFNSESHQISWRHLYYILNGLRLFVVGQRQSTTHYQTLGCRIIDEKEGKIGVATLAYFNPGPPPGVERRAMADPKNSRGLMFTQSAKPTNQTMLSVFKDPTPVPLPWSIPDTDLTLTFEVFGDEILLIELVTLLGVGQLRIASNVRQIPNEPIGSYRYQNGPGTLVLSFVTYGDKTITWLQLHEILVGLTQFCSDDHSRAAFFEIGVAGEGTAGFGVITNGPIAIPIQKRGSGTDFFSTSNSTSMSSKNTTALLGTFPPYPIPGTSVTLKVIFLGVTAISPVELAATLTSALRAIQPHVVAEGHQAIPGHRWTYEDRITKITFNFSLEPGRTVLWQELNWILIGVLHWMTADGSNYCKIMAFDIEIEGQEGLVGDGFVVYDPSHPKVSTFRLGESSALVEKMSSAPANKISFSPSPATRQTTQTLYRQNPAVKRDLDAAELARVRKLLVHATQLPQTIPARSVPSSNGTHLTLPITYNVPDTNIVLRIQVLPTVIPTIRITGIFNAARSMLIADVIEHPDAHFDEAVFFSEVNFMAGREVVAIEIYPLAGEHLTYGQLYYILNGLQRFINGATGRPFPHSNTFKIEIEGRYVAVGQLSYHFVQTSSNTDTALTSRSPPPPESNATLTDTIPYPILGTPITLAFTSLLPTPIPEERVPEFFYYVFEAFEGQMHHRHGSSSFRGPRWNYDHLFLPNLDMSLTVFRKVGKQMTWKNLGDVLNGLYDFIEGRWRPGPSMQALNFDIEIVERGVVGKGELSYKPRGLGGGGVALVGGISNDTSTS